MNNTAEVKIIAIDTLAEECVTLLIHGITIECFANYRPYTVAIGETHLIEITIDYSEPLQIEKSAEPNAFPEKIGNGYGYYLHGVLDGEIFRSFTDFSDEDIHYDYPELVGKPVKIKADRINVNFLQLLKL
ncbi:hypothetical protein [Pseudomonas alvandae]|uniref:Uncharacterized protein n=1 Tax=Pseudomonas canavaninivorans TaxID=2842348 RepID=A0ABX8QCI9_PSECO|nr:hypothetical protein [Pseudomonas alvandae]QXI52865.1 hypothetical protein KSS97_25610 [Pseudomonas alvandae]